MTGKGVIWTEERRQAQRDRMKARMADPVIREETMARLQAGNLDPATAAAASLRMKALNERARTDQELKTRMVEGATSTRRKPAHRAKQSKIMAQTMARPENREKAREHAIALNTDLIFRRRQEAGKRRKRGPGARGHEGAGDSG